jgi:hypothetical protein
MTFSDTTAAVAIPAIAATLKPIVTFVDVFIIRHLPLLFYYDNTLRNRKTVI